jgi:hypothetical protein
MKFLLTLIMCSYTEATCLPPFTHPEKFRDAYDCLLKGYDEADKKIKEIGREDVNKHQIYIFSPLPTPFSLLGVGASTT